MGEDDVPPLELTALGYLRAVLRGLVLAVLVFGCLLILLLLRLAERPLHGVQRPWTPHITQFVCRNAFRILGIRYESHGERMTEPGAVVANHSSWLDIFTLNAEKRVYFVAKAEVASWPGIGWLARATGTVFIRRDAREAAAQKQIFEERLTAGHKLLFFPEGTSTDGLRVLPFKPTLFAAFFSDALRDVLWVQPVTVVYHAPRGAEERFYGWWGDMSFASHLAKTLAAWPQGRVEVWWHKPVRVNAFKDRKALARHCEIAVREAHPLAVGKS
ncbi:1-acyl-sn-glycerol-3-phosphate acyltransferase [Alphaproteobacteria bacterium GH1-50]|uniref:1-acyl-sn-glycerol-3-phosphate acyltransferase n=1 Tax=Kangsaoukella pontilimi TaxID=2691042 RepID=A0A7C9MA77_9RHOB|nr:lysophospholipid acyltransferase family protein [Kangsaoukella pontilimi]MXQ07813.1 1-acyl-sn-glycerol-3-phosphate acyltransferase [Kangsaoukella pontilimi]